MAMAFALILAWGAEGHLRVSRGCSGKEAAARNPPYLDGLPLEGFQLLAQILISLEEPKNQRSEDHRGQNEALKWRLLTCCASASDSKVMNQLSL